VVTSTAGRFGPHSLNSEICDVVIQTNNVNIDDRGYIYAVDRSSTGLHIVELAGEAREIVGLGSDPE
jgi:hypothetical protein